RHREAALAALGAVGPIAPQYPRAAGAGLAVAEAVVAGPAEIAVVGPPGDPRTAALHTTALLGAPRGAGIAPGGGAAAGRGGGTGGGRGGGGRGRWSRRGGAWARGRRSAAGGPGPGGRRTGCLRLPRFHLPHAGH